MSSNNPAVRADRIAATSMDRQRQREMTRVWIVVSRRLQSAGRKIPTPMLLAQRRDYSNDLSSESAPGSSAERIADEQHVHHGIRAFAFVSRDFD